MSELLKALILGLIQGLTEFLPVSSSGHIELGKALLNFDAGEDDLLFTIVVHFATVLSTIVVFRKDIWSIIKGLFAFKWNDETQYSSKILLSMIPVAIVGVFFEDKVESLFGGNILLVGLMLLVTASLLFLAQVLQQKHAEGKIVGYKEALLIGIAQAVAVIPGISRSGSTISTGLMLGIDKTRLTRFSFLMVLPPILGAMLLKAKELMETGIGAINLPVLLIGFLAAFFSGLIACTWMINIVRKGKLSIFAIYCLIVGLIALTVAILK